MLARMTVGRGLVLTSLVVLGVTAQTGGTWGDEALGTRRYDDFERPTVCVTCHVDIARQHEQAMMSQAYTHSWDEIEYFELAPKREPSREYAEDVVSFANDVFPVLQKAGCLACHGAMLISISKSTLT